MTRSPAGIAGQATWSRVTPSDQQQLGLFEVGRSGAVAPGVTPYTPVTSTSAPCASSSSSRAVKHVVQRSQSRSSPATFRSVARSCSTPVAASKVSPSSRKRIANGAENADTAIAPPGRTDRTICANTSGSSRPPSSPKPPWQRQIAASNRPSNARSRTSRTSKSIARPSADAASRARATKSGERSIPVTAIPRRASSRAWRPGPHPTSRTCVMGTSPNASTRKSTSCSVPLVKAFLR